MNSPSRPFRQQLGSSRGLVIRVGLHGPCVIVRVTGELRAEDVPVLRKYLERGVAFRHPPWLVVDLSGVTSIDDHGLALLTEASDLVGRFAGRFLLTGLDPGLHGSPADPSLQVRQSLEGAIAELVDEATGKRHQ